MFTLIIGFLGGCLCGTERAGSVKEELETKLADYGCFNNQPCYIVSFEHGGASELDIYQCASDPTLITPEGYSELWGNPQSRQWHEGGPNTGGVTSYTLYADGSGEFTDRILMLNNMPNQKADPEMVAFVESVKGCGKIAAKNLPQAATWESLYGQDWQVKLDQHEFEIDCQPADCMTYAKDGHVALMR